MRWVSLRKFQTDLLTYFKSEQVCRDYLELIRWNGKARKHRLFLVTIGTRLYVSTDYHEIHRFGLTFGNPFIDMFEELSHIEQPLRLLTEDFRTLRY